MGSDCIGCDTGLGLTFREISQERRKHRGISRQEQG